MGRASGDSNTPHWVRSNILDFQRAMSVKITVENGKICNEMTIERDCKEFVKFGLLMSLVVLDWTLSRRCRKDLGAPPLKWEQYSREGRIWGWYIINNREGKK